MTRSEILNRDAGAAAAIPAFERLFFNTGGDACHAFGRTVSRREFLARAAALAAELDTAANSPAGLLACDDTLNFALGLCALLRAGRDVVLPPNLRPETLQAGAFANLPRIDDARVASITSGHSDHPGEPLPLDPERRLVLFTSGSTGEPKRIEKTLRQLSAEADVLEAAFGSRLGDADIVATVPHIHIYGMLFRVIWPLAHGRVFTASTQLVARASHAPPKALVSSPAFLTRIDARDLAANPPRVIFSSGGRLPETCAREVAQACGAPLIEVYGSTETGGIAWREWRPDCDRLWTPFAGARLRFEQDGILAVRSAATGDHWLVTGDAAQGETDGRFRLAGRADGVLKIEDKRVSPYELAAHLEGHAWIAEARLLELGGNRKQLGAVIRLGEAGERELRRAGRATLIAALKAHMLQRFEPVVVPRRWRFVAAYPVNAMGKTTVADLARLFRRAEDA